MPAGGMEAHADPPVERLLGVEQDAFTLPQLLSVEPAAANSRQCQS